jgi:hypothetical protein
VDFLKQAVTITGLGTHAFTKAVDSMEAIEEIFSRQVGQDTILPWKNGTYLDWTTMFSSNRYFTSRRSNFNLQAVPFDPFVDPEGVLASMAGNDKVHCSDNVVEYYELTSKNK